jgi:outer membrane protein
MRFLLSATLGVALTLGAADAAAQARDSVAGPILSLEEAQGLARRNNPVHQQTVNNRTSAIAQRRAAYGAFLPNANASLSGSFREGGQTFFQGQSFGAANDIRQSSYNLSLNYSLNASKFLAPRVAHATVDAVEADISGSQEVLRAEVTRQYLNVLQAIARAELQDTLLRTAQVQLDLANARASAGAATQLDVRRAEVTFGQQEVAAINARNQVEIEKLRLFQQMGVSQPANVQLVTQFPVSTPTFTLDSILQLSQRRNPVLEALRSREKVSSLSYRQAQSLYTPTLSLNTGWGGYTSAFTNTGALVEQARAQTIAGQSRCQDEQAIRASAGLAPTQDCSQIVFTDAMASAIRSENEKYPFDFTKDPWSISATLSIPIFDGLQREQRVQEAAAQRNDARWATRRQELQLTADVTAAYLTLTTAARTVELQQRTSASARDQLTLTEERYRVGAASYVELTDARAAYERAETDRINAIYDYHRAYAALESAVGRPLR